MQEMRKILSIAETLRKAAGGDSVRASADALYDESKGELTVYLSLSDPVNEPDVVHLKAPMNEADPATREIFHHWIQRLIKQGSFCIET